MRGFVFEGDIRYNIKYEFEKFFTFLISLLIGIGLFIWIRRVVGWQEIKNALYKTAKDLGKVGWDKYYGYGRVNALAAINSI